MFHKGLTLISRRKFNAWLLQFHPLLEGGWSWDLWFAAGRGLPFLPPEVIGLVHWSLYQQFMVTLEGEGMAFVLPYECDEYDEGMLLLPWLKQNLLPTLFSLSQGELITPLLRHPPLRRS